MALNQEDQKSVKMQKGIIAAENQNVLCTLIYCTIGGTSSVWQTVFVSGNQVSFSKNSESSRFLYISKKGFLLFNASTF